MKKSQKNQVCQQIEIKRQIEKVAVFFNSCCWLWKKTLPAQITNVGITQFYRWAVQ